MPQDNYPSAYREGSRKYGTVPRTGLSTPTAGGLGESAAPIAWQRNPGNRSAVIISLPGSGPLPNISNPANENYMGYGPPPKPKDDPFVRRVKAAIRLGRKHWKKSAVLRNKTKIAELLYKRTKGWKDPATYFNAGGAQPIAVCNWPIKAPITRHGPWAVGLACLQGVGLAYTMDQPIDASEASTGFAIGGPNTLPPMFAEQSEIKFGPGATNGYRVGYRSDYLPNGKVAPIDTMWDPMAQPLLAPRQDPNAQVTPWHAINLKPKADPLSTEATRVGSAVGTASGLMVRPQVNPLLGEATGTRLKAVTVTATAGGRANKPPTVKVALEHKHAKPPDGVREGKARVAGKASAAAVAAFGAVTEAGDFFEALWDALPEKFRKREMAKRHGKKPKMADMAWQVASNMPKLDVPKAIMNVLANQVEDAVIGAGGQALKSASAKLAPHRPLGFGSGPAL